MLISVKGSYFHLVEFECFLLQGRKKPFFFFKLLGSLDMGFNSPHPCSMMLLTKGQCFLQTFVSCFPSDLIQVGENSAVGKKGRLEGQRA